MIFQGVCAVAVTDCIKEGLLQELSSLTTSAVRCGVATRPKYWSRNLVHVQVS